jgi:hypothetical protein
MNCIQRQDWKTAAQEEDDDEGQPVFEELAS